MENIDGLINDAIWLCRKYEKVSPPLFQRLLMIDGDTAEIVFWELQKTGLLTNIEIVGLDEDDPVRVGEVDKEILLELSKN